MNRTHRLRGRLNSGQFSLTRLFGIWLIGVLLLALAPASLVAAEPHELRVPVLIYHHVACDSPSNMPNQQIWICPSRFEAQLKYLKDRGWRTITTDQLADHMKNRTCPAPRTMIVTVDDSARVGYTNAAPILERLGMRGTYFVMAGLANNSSAMTFAQMRDLRARGHGIGNHSMTHLDLVGRSQSVLYREVEKSQQIFDQELGFRPRTFAYPNGTHDAAVRQRVSDSGFELAFTADPTYVISSAKPLVAPRLFVSKRHDPSLIASKIEPYAQPCTTSSDGPTAGAPQVAFPAGSAIATDHVRIRVDWSAGAPSGASFQLQQRRDGASWSSVSLPSTRASSVDLLRKPGRVFEYRVRASTGGSYGPWATGSAYNLRAYQESHSAVALSGSWSLVSLSSAFGGALSQTTSASARASMSFNGSSIGWVAQRGPKRGLVDVYLDGTLAATVDLYAGSAQPRRLVFTRSWSGSSAHSVELRPRGTAGRPRADLDAFVVLER